MNKYEMKQAQKLNPEQIQRQKTEIPPEMHNKYNRNQSIFGYEVKREKPFAEFINDVDNFLEQASDESDYSQRLTAIFSWIIKDLTDEAEERQDAIQRTLISLLKRGFKKREGSQRVG